MVHQVWKVELLDRSSRCSHACWNDGLALGDDSGRLVSLTKVCKKVVVAHCLFIAYYVNTFQRDCNTRLSKAVSMFVLLCSKTPTCSCSTSNPRSQQTQGTCSKIRPTNFTPDRSRGVRQLQRPAGRHNVSHHLFTPLHGRWRHPAQPRLSRPHHDPHPTLVSAQPLPGG